MNFVADESVDRQIVERLREDGHSVIYVAGMDPGIPDPKRFGGKANHKQEPWKLPLPEFIEKLYFKRFKKDRPDNVRSIEQMVKDKKRNQAERKERKRQHQESESPQEASQQLNAPDLRARPALRK